MVRHHKGVYSVRGWRAFLRDRTGVVLVAFAVMLPMLVAAVGASMDMSEVYLVRQRLAGTLDASALAGTASSSDPATIQANVAKFFAANYPSGDLGTTRGLTTTVNGQNVTVSAYADYNTQFMKVLGINTVSVYRTTTVVRQVQGLEVALVLDNTGSMADANKIGALQTAATDLVNILYAATSDPTTIKVGLIPYAESVRIGYYGLGKMPDGKTPYYDAATDTVIPFITLPSDVTYTSSKTASSGWYGCVVEHYPNAPTDKDTTEVANSRGQLWTSSEHPFAAHGWDPSKSTNDDYPQDIEDTYAGPWDIYQYGTASKTCSQYKCQTYYTSGAQKGQCQKYYTSGTSNCQTWTYKYAAVNGYTPNEGCPYANIQPLTSNQSTLLADIKTMQPEGDTRGDIGIMWGYRVLSPDPPFTEGSQWGDQKWKKAIIMMTDGMNTKDNDYAGDWFASGNQLGVTDYNNRFLDVCNALKAQGVIIYTIIFGTNGQYPGADDTTKSYYQQCASDASKYIDDESNDSLISTFQSIANQLSNLHISN